MPSGLVAVVFSTIVFMNPIGARFAFGTPLTLRTLVAAALGVAGVALLFLPELDAARHGGSAALGIAFGLGGTVIATVGNLIAVRNHNVGLADVSHDRMGHGLRHPDGRGGGHRHGRAVDVRHARRPTSRRSSTSRCSAASSRSAPI